MRRLSLYVAALAALLATVGGVARSQSGEPYFPQATVDYFAAPDEGVPLGANEARGGDTWLIWIARN
jgi:hypothetical protein